MLGPHQTLWELGISLTPLPSHLLSDSIILDQLDQPGEGGRGISHPDSEQLSICSFFLLQPLFPSQRLVAQKFGERPHFSSLLMGHIMVTGENPWDHCLCVLQHPSKGRLMFLRLYPALPHDLQDTSVQEGWYPEGYLGESELYKARKTHTPSPRPSKQSPWFLYPHSLWRSHKDPARMLMSESHLTAMLASAGAPSGNCRQFLCLYASEARKAGNMVQLNVCPRRVQLPGLGLACLFVSLFTAPPATCLVAPGALPTTDPPRVPCILHLCLLPYCLVPELSNTHPEHMCGSALSFLGGAFASLYLFSPGYCAKSSSCFIVWGAGATWTVKTVISEEAGHAG